MEENFIENNDTDHVRKMLLESGYSDKAVSYYIDKPYMGILENPDHVTEMVGTCGDTMKVYLKVVNGNVEKVRYQVLGCPGAVSAAMAAVELVEGKTLAQAKLLDDGDVFRVLKEIPGKKHHCIQLAVKALHKALDEYKNDSGS